MLFLVSFGSIKLFHLGLLILFTNPVDVMKTHDDEYQNKS